MKSTNRHVFVLLALLLLLCSLTAQGLPLPPPELSPAQQQRAISDVVEHHSFSPPILKHYYAGGELPYWSVRGSTVVTDNYIRLTPDESSQVGHLWNRHPLGMTDFEIIIGVAMAKQNMGADGLALWVTQEAPGTAKLSNAQINGHSMNFKGFGIVLDTYDNDGLHDNPTIGILVNDGTIQKFSPQKDFVNDYLASCIFDYRSPSRKHISTIRVRYSKGVVSVYASKNQELKEELCFTVEDIDIDVKKDRYYIGLTAETGAMHQEHDVVFMHTLPLEGVEYDHDVYVLRETEEAEMENTQAKPRAETSSSTPTSSTTSSSAPSSASMEQMKKLEEELERLKKMAAAASSSPPETKKAASNRKSQRYVEEEEEDDDDDEEEEEVVTTRPPKKTRGRKRRSTRRARDEE